MQDELLLKTWQSSVNAALEYLPEQMRTPEACVLMLAIGLQESRFVHRYQVVANKPGIKGPARGFWQFERGGGCKGVLEHPTSKYWMLDACKRHGVKPTPVELWLAIENDDILAATAARLLLFTDPKRLPAVDDVQGAWNYYTRTWRPGKPHRQTWDAFHARSLAFVREVWA